MSGTVSGYDLFASGASLLACLQAGSVSQPGVMTCEPRAWNTINAELVQPAWMFLVEDFRSDDG